MNELYSNSGQQQMGGFKDNQYLGLSSLNFRKVGIYNSSNNLQGGSKTVIEDIGHPEYIKNEDFKKFMESFYLIRYVCNTKSSSVYIIPPTAKLNKMITEFNKILENEKIQVGSSEAVYFAMNNKKYTEHLRSVFTIHANSGDNYRLDNLSLCFGSSAAATIKKRNIHNYRNFNPVIRTNVAGEQYKFIYVDETSIKVSNDIVTENGSKGQITTVKLIARCDNGIFVFQGDLPEPKTKYERSLTGGKSDNAGQNKKLSKVEYFIKSHNKDKTCKKFICSMLKEAKDTKQDLKPYYEDFSSNFIHTAFKLCFDERIKEVPEDDKMSNKMMDNLLTELCKNMKLINKNINTGDFSKVINNTYMNSIQGCEDPMTSTKNFMKSLMSIYKNNKLEFNADVATALYLQNDFTEKDIQDIFSFMTELNNYEKSDLSKISKSEYNFDNHNNQSTSYLNKLVKGALSESPFIGTISKTYYPILTGGSLSQSDNAGSLSKSDSEEEKEKSEEEKEKSDSEELEGGIKLDNAGKKKTQKKKNGTMKKKNEETETEFDLSNYI